MNVGTLTPLAQMYEAIEEEENKELFLDNQLPQNKGIIAGDL